MFFTTQLKIVKFMGRSQDLNVGPSYLRYEHRVKKLGQLMDHVNSYATLKFRKNEVFVSKMF